MNLSATLLAQPIQPGKPGLAGSGERGGQRTKSTDAAFLRDLRAELARPARSDRTANPGGSADRTPTTKGRGAGTESAPTREAGRPDRDPASGTARTQHPDDAPGSPTAIHTETQSAGRTDAQAEGAASSPTDAAATEGPDAPSDARAGQQPTDPGTRGSTGATSVAERSRAEQAQAARAIPADRPLTVAELNEALASADVATWPESLRRQLGLDRPAATPAPGPRRPTADSAQPNATPGWDVKGDAPGDLPAAEPLHADSASASPDPSLSDPTVGSRLGPTTRTASQDAPLARETPVADDRAQAAHGSRGAPARAEHAGPGPGAAGFVLASQSTPRDAAARPDASPVAPPIATSRIFQLERTGPAILARGPSHADQGSLARQDEAVASQLARGVAAAAEAKDGSVRLHLRPEALGAMTVSVQRGGGTGRVGDGVSVAFAVENPETAAMLERSLGDLSAALEERGIIVRKASIEVRDARTNHAALAPTPNTETRPEATPAEPRPQHDQHQAFDQHQPGQQQPFDHGNAGRDRHDTLGRDGSPRGHDAAAEVHDDHHDGPAPAHAIADARTNLTLRLDAIG